MSIDAPLIVYDKEKKKRKKGEKAEFSKPKGSSVLQKRLEWEKKYSNKESDKSPSISFDLSNFKLQ